MNTTRGNQDFGDILKLMLEMPTPAQPEPDATAGVVEPEMKQKSVTVLVAELRKAISVQMNTFQTGLAALDKRMGAVMSQLTSTASTDSSSATALAKKVEELKADYESKSQEVDMVLQKVEELLPNLQGMPEASSRLAKIQSALSDMKSQLEGKAGEIDSLTKSLSSTRAGAMSDMQDMQKQIIALDDYAADVERQLQAAQKDIERLETHLNKGQRMKVPASALDHKVYGGFDLKEHLERARKKQGITETWF